MQLLQNLFSGARHLLFPRLCCGCQKPLLPAEKMVCLVCMPQLSRTGYHHAPMNETMLRITGRFPLERATSFSYFAQDGLIQHLLHLIKYSRRDDLAFELGEIFGAELKATGFLEGIDALVPVPLHFRKQWKRGYNQSERMAAGIEEATGTPEKERILKRTRHTESQTSKTVAERVLNMKDAFQVRPTTTFSGNHFLLIDDVLTTGATLESCATALLKAFPNCRISIATAALAAS